MLIMLQKEFQVSFFSLNYIVFCTLKIFQGCPLVHSSTDQRVVDVEFMCLQVRKNIANNANNSEYIYYNQAFPFLKEVASDNYIKVT